MQKPGYTPFRWRRRSPGYYVSTWPMEVWSLTRLGRGWQVQRRRSESDPPSVVLITPKLKNAQQYAENYVPPAWANPR